MRPIVEKIVYCPWTWNEYVAYVRGNGKNFKCHKDIEYGRCMWNKNVKKKIPLETLFKIDAMTSVCPWPKSMRHEQLIGVYSIFDPDEKR